MTNRSIQPNQNPLPQALLVLAAAAENQRQEVASEYLLLCWMLGDVGASHVGERLGDQPVIAVDPTGLILRYVSAPMAPIYNFRNAQQGAEILTRELLGATGSEVTIDKNGNIMLGKQVKTGGYWDTARSKLQDIINSDKVVGVATNTDSLIGWAFNLIASRSSGTETKWAQDNGLDAWLSFSWTGYTYKAANTDFWSWLVHTTPVDGTPAAAMAHELGHAHDYVDGTLDTATTKTDAENSAVAQENEYHRAMKERERVEY